MLYIAEYIHSYSLFKEVFPILMTGYIGAYKME